MFALWEYKEDIRRLISFLKLIKDLMALSDVRQKAIQQTDGAWVELVCFQYFYVHNSC